VVAQEALPHLTRSRGCYVAVGSINGLGSSPNLLGYGVARAGIASLVRTLAVEFGPVGVRFNAVAPGLVRTPQADEAGFTSGELGRTFAERILLREFATSVDVAVAAYSLMSPLGRHVNGHVRVVDGGSTANYCLPMVPA
jgi:meso-butanediol dehydrogenase/(S,S)-butanediol dehydrogenase/diacetyl reductase